MQSAPAWSGCQRAGEQRFSISTDQRKYRPYRHGALRRMSTELLFLLLLVALVLANVALEFIARWRNPPTGEFIDYSASWKNSSSGNNLRNAELVSESNPRECTKNSRNSMNCFTTGSETSTLRKENPNL
jgi:hypothetical protein